MKQILVVDDDPAILDVVADILRESGYRVETAVNGAEALRKLAGIRPDAVLLDLMMPVMDGWTFVAEYRRDAECATIPIVVMSAARDVVAAARELGAQACITKPFEIDALLDTVERLAASNSQVAA